MQIVLLRSSKILQRFSERFFEDLSKYFSGSLNILNDLYDDLWQEDLWSSLKFF